MLADDFLSLKKRSIEKQRRKEEQERTENRGS